jgi:hypothetical protein
MSIQLLQMINVAEPQAGNQKFTAAVVCMLTAVSVDLLEVS